MKRTLLLAALLTACGEYDGFEWRKVAQPATTVQWRAVGQAGVWTMCPHFPGYQTHACAFYAPSMCTIFAEVEENRTPRWLVKHERRHCDGWAHNLPGQSQ